MSSPSPHDDEAIQSLYAKRQKIYPRQVHGLFAKLKVSSVLILLGLYYGVPWLQWNGRQAVLFDLPNRQFHIFGLTFWPQDFIYLAALLIIAGLSLFFFTALAGRLWCGFACPQTVWTDTFLWIERLVEGDRSAQMKLDKAEFSWRKFRLKATKHTLWIVFAGYTGFTFVGYFTPILELWGGIVNFSLGGWEWFWMIFYGFATYGNAGWMREQVCIYMCPYARFQSAMFNKDTMIIAYDQKRGEPRGSRKRGEDPKSKGLGDCVSCTLCVQVCPTGIDIRDGLQYQCISCSACVDVCDEVMEKMNYPKGLIRYTTENAMHGKPVRVLRPRIVLYGLVLLGLLASLLVAIGMRTPLGLDVIRDRNTLFRETGTGQLENVYVLKLLNMDTLPHEYRLEVSGAPSLNLEMDSKVLKVESGGVLEVPARLQIEPVDMHSRSLEVEFQLTAIDDPHLSVVEKARFVGPLPPR